MAVLLAGGRSAKAPASSLRALCLLRRGTEPLVAWQYLPVAKYVPKLKTLGRIAFRCPTGATFSSWFACHGRFSRDFREIQRLIGRGKELSAAIAAVPITLVARGLAHVLLNFGEVLARSSQFCRRPPENCQIRQTYLSSTLRRVPTPLEIPTAFLRTSRELLPYFLTLQNAQLDGSPN